MVCSVGMYFLMYCIEIYICFYRKQKALSVCCSLMINNVFLFLFLKTDHFNAFKSFCIIFEVHGLEYDYVLFLFTGLISKLLLFQISFIYTLDTKYRLGIRRMYRNRW